MGESPWAHSRVCLDSSLTKLAILFTCKLCSRLAPALEREGVLALQLTIRWLTKSTGMWENGRESPEEGKYKPILESQIDTDCTVYLTRAASSSDTAAPLSAVTI